MLNNSTQLTPIVLWDIKAEKLVFCAISAVLCTATVLGNIFVLVAIMINPKLTQKLTSVLLSNLAVADLLVGSIVMPLAIVQILTNGLWPLGRFLCRVWTSLDVICCTASIVTLCAISIDRFVGVLHPLQYKSIVTRQRLLIAVGVIWAFSIGVLFATVRYDMPRQATETYECNVGDELEHVTYSVVFSFFIPLVIILVVYLKIYRVTRNRERSLLYSMMYNITATKKISRRSQQEDASVLSETKYGALPTGDIFPGLRVHYGGAETAVDRQRRSYLKHKKSAKTLGIVVGAFLGCWFPFFALYLVDHFCGCVGEIAFTFFTWLGYTNSAVNPVIYAITVKTFRDTFSSMCHKAIPCTTVTSGVDEPHSGLNQVHLIRRSFRWILSKVSGGSIANNVCMSPKKAERVSSEESLSASDRNGNETIIEQDQDSGIDIRLAKLQRKSVQTSIYISQSSSWMNLKLYRLLISDKCTEV